MHLKKLLRICAASDVPPGEGKRFVVGTLDVAVFNVDGVFYVIDDTCTHGPSSLAEGFLDGDVVECVAHHGAFHIPTGRPVKFPCVVPVRTYPTEVIDGQVCIDAESNT